MFFYFQRNACLSLFFPPLSSSVLHFFYFSSFFTPLGLAESKHLCVAHLANVKECIFLRPHFLSPVIHSGTLVLIQSFKAGTCTLLLSLFGHAPFPRLTFFRKKYNVCINMEKAASNIFHLICNPRQDVHLCYRSFCNLSDPWFCAGQTSNRTEENRRGRGRNPTIWSG